MYVRIMIIITSILHIIILSCNVRLHYDYHNVDSASVF